MAKRSKTMTVTTTRTIALVQADITCGDCGETFHWEGYSGKLPQWCEKCKADRVRAQKREWARAQAKELKKLRRSVGK